MNRVLLKQSVRDSWLLLACCCALTFGFIGLRIWVASKIRADAFIRLFSGALRSFSRLLPVPIEDLASPLGRTAFSYEEMPVILLLGLWAVARGSDCIAGRVGAGTMEMLLAQPLRRVTLVTTHSVVTFIGVIVFCMFTVAGIAAGLAVSQFEPPPKLVSLLPATFNFLGFGIFLVGFATLTSALSRTRAQAVGIVMGFYVIQLSLLIVSRLAPSAEWLEAFTIVTVHQPTMLAVGIAQKPETYWLMFWQYNAILVGLGVALWLAAAAIFCRRDVPAPL